jgi:hypothetical protein
VGIGGYLADFEVVIVVETFFPLCTFCLQVCDCQRVAQIARARSLFRVSCMWENCRFGCLWLYV